MGRHSRPTCPARHAATRDPGAANYVGRVGALAVALGIGVAVAHGAGVAYADEGTSDSSSSAGPAHSSTTASSTTASSSTTSSSSTASATASVGETTAGGHAGAGSPSTSADAPKATVTSRTPGTATTKPAKPGKHSSATATLGTAESTTTASTRDDDPADAAPTAAAPTATAVTASAVAPTTGSSTSSSTRTGDAPVAPTPDVLGALQLVRRDTETASLVKPAAAVTTTAQPSVAAAPSPTDVAHTPYGDVSPWLLQPNGQIANYGGVPHDGKTVLETVNVIILDPSSTSTAESVARLDQAMTRAGFPAQPIHTTGFLGVIDGTTYGQQPAGFLQAFSDNFFLFPNDHGRVFGPAPATTGTGYVYTGAFSSETLNPANPFTHAYVSSDVARTELARRLVASGAATVVGYVPLGNAYDDGTFTTGDHDGYAVVLQLTPSVVAVLPVGGVLGAACGHVDDLPGPVARQFATGLCVFAAQVSTSLGLRSVI